MSSLTRCILRIGDWISERTNPLLVKEVRQSLKSRQFVASFGLVLLACWLISVGGTLMSGAQPTMVLAARGREFFSAFYFVLSFAIYVIVPFQAFRSLIVERDQYTFELLSITTMTPGQIVRGKLCSALIQTGLFYSAIAPFVAMTLLLRGTSFPTILYVLTWSLLISAGLSVLALTVGANCKSRGYQTGLTVVVVGMLLACWASFLQAILWELNYSDPMFNRYEFWLQMAVLLSYYICYFMLFVQICVSSLTFEADNRTTKVRIWLMMLFWLTFAWAIFGIFYAPSHIWVDMEGELAMFLFLHILLAGIITCFESDRFSHRVLRRLNENRFRMLLLPLLPGGTRGLIFCYLHLAISFGLVMLIAAKDVNFILGAGLYTVIYLSFGAWFSRLFQRFGAAGRPNVMRILLILFYLFAGLAPYILYAFERYPPPVYLCVSDPVATLEHLSHDQMEYSLTLNVLAIVALITVSLNLFPIVRILVETMVLDHDSKNDKSLTPYV